MADLTYQYGGAVVSITDRGQRGGAQVFDWAVSGLAGLAAASTTGTAATQAAAITAAELGILNLGTNSPAFPIQPGIVFPSAATTLQTYATNSPDSALATPLSTFDEEFNGTAYNPNVIGSKWTQVVNGAGSNFAQNLSWYSIKSSPTVAGNLCALTQAVPNTTAFRITCKMRVNGDAATAPIGGMVLTDGTKYVMIGTLTATNTVTYATFATATSTPSSVATVVTDQRPLYWAIDYGKAVAANVQYLWSMDGVRWTDVTVAAYTGFTTTKATFLAATVTACGFGAASGIVADGNLNVACDWMHHVL